MDDIIPRVSPLSNPGVRQVDSETYDRDPGRGERQQRRKGERKPEPEEAPASSPERKKMDIRV